MRTDSPVTMKRADYAPPGWTVETVALDFTLDDHDTRVDARSGLRRQAGGDLLLDAEDLLLESLALDGRVLSPAEFSVEPAEAATPEAGGLRLAGGCRVRVPAGLLPASTAELRVITRIAPAANTALSGLYRSGGNYCTQCEAEGFRRITAFPDRPDVMARYEVLMRAPKDTVPVLLSNGNLLAQGPCAPDAQGDARGPDGWHWARWQDPFPKPSYLFALVAGRLVAASEETIRTASGREALLQVWVEPGNEDRTAHAMASLVKSIRWDEERFGLELDLDRFMIVAVADFNMGAMENKGLNVFNTKYVFAHPRLATDTDYANVESVVAHEYFHNWTGNRVTCRDWFQLTLKEGLTVFRDQEFSADMLAHEAATPAAAASARAVRRIDDVRLLRTAQFPEDAGPMAHPIRPDAYQEINNFYTVTVYEKGAEVIRMLQTLVGREGFRRGMDLYFQRHDGQAVTCDDFVAAIADANGRDLSRFGRWYATAGTPRVQAQGRWDAARCEYHLRLRQFTPPTPGQADKAPLHIPFALGLVGPDGQDLPLRLEGAGQASAGTVVLDLLESEQHFVFSGVDVEPVPSLLRDFSAPVVVEAALTDTQLAFLLRHDGDAFNRWECSQKLAVGCVLAAMRGEDGPLDVLVDGWRRIVEDDGLDPAWKELAFSLPAEGFVAEQLDEVDPVAVRAARDHVRAELGRRLADGWRALVAGCATPGPYSPDAVSAGRRALRHAALAYLCAAGDAAAQDEAAQRVRDADNMTDRLGALGALAAGASPRLDEALAAFEHEFRDEPLAMDKWFTLQATLHRAPGGEPVLARVRRLMSHPAFSIRNPNKVRALVGAFCSGNLAEFHAPDGSGHAFWTEQVLALDAVNPQVAARVARALDRWRKFAPPARTAMEAALRQVQSQARSPDVLEVVGKALA